MVHVPRTGSTCRKETTARTWSMPAWTRIARCSSISPSAIRSSVQCRWRGVALPSCTNLSTIENAGQYSIATIVTLSYATTGFKRPREQISGTTTAWVGLEGGCGRGGVGFSICFLFRRLFRRIFCNYSQLMLTQPNIQKLVSYLFRYRNINWLRGTKEHW